MINSGLLAGIIFIIMYVFIASEKINRTVVAMLGSLLMVLTGKIPQEKAIHYIDFNTLALLIGLMIIVTIIGQTGVFNYIAIYAAKVAKGEPKRILIILALITAVCSAFLDNVTTVLLIVPVTISITKKLKVDPIPFLITQIIASNIGGTATLIGDPPNIMIGSAVKELTFLAFIQNLAPIAVINLIVVVGILSFLYRKKLMAQDSLKAEIMKLEPEAEIKDRRLLKKSLGILMLTLLGFFMHQSLNLESSTIALTGGFLLLATVGKKHNFIESVLEKIEWGTIFFFIGLFIAVGALIETGIIKQIALYCFEITKGEVLETSLLVLWLSAIISAFLDNIPFVATMIPLIFDMGNMGIVNLEPIWWSLALGACLGGNGTIIGASANLIVAAMAAEKGHNISFVKYLKVGFPVMLLTILISTSYVYLRFLN